MATQRFGWRRACALVGVASVVANTVTGCPPRRDTSLPTAFGARITNGELRIWTGSPCHDVTRVTVQFSPADAEFVLEPPPGQLADVDHFAVARTNPGLEVVKPLPKRFTWRNVKWLELRVFGDQGHRTDSALLADVVRGSKDHPEDTYWFQGIGWLNPARVAEEDGKSFITPCTPDPKRPAAREVEFGARVTEGRLQLWTGEPCTDVKSVGVYFLPDRSPPDLPELELAPQAATTATFDRFTLGEPTPGFVARQPLPNEFDWRIAKRVGLEFTFADGHSSHNMFLDEVVGESANHPTDTFWFPDVGWLNPAQAANFIGTRFTGMCDPSVR